MNVGYVGRYDNGSGYMEWAGRPVDTVAEAKGQVEDETWTSRDVVEVEEVEGDRGDRELSVVASVVASAPLGQHQQWKDAYT